MNSLGMLRLTTIVCSLCAGLVGCSNSPPDSPVSGGAHQQEEEHLSAEDVPRPENYSAAVSRIGDYCSTIRKALDEKDNLTAHRALDELNFVIEWLPEIAQESNVPKRHWESLNTASQELRELFDAVHMQLDEGNRPDYAAIAPQVDSYMETLSQVAEQTASNNAETKS